MYFDLGLDGPNIARSGGRYGKFLTNMANLMHRLVLSYFVVFLDYGVQIADFNETNDIDGVPNLCDGLEERIVVIYV